MAELHEPKSGIPWEFVIGVCGWWVVAPMILCVLLWVFWTRVLPAAPFVIAYLRGEVKKNG